ncbi:hypothetical protein [Aquibacillus rhizosphaerae]|uniref:Peptidyl-prolyl cis-trans isomerase n=1 Tax=Aquibacillus rhizosphaerae TaxID=3051431 RepID=A0ABT7L630_9BACI|nr:hypothetical protein [Aquibacillus sp. LR5S19]MDL4841305.1 hypothetical protein [Aquibacillus sp. LR5S19]
MESEEIVIIQLMGNVTYPITLDPTVWIFDDRKITFDQAFQPYTQQKEPESDELKKASERFNKEIYQHKIKPPVNKSIARFEREKILVSTYVMPIIDFLQTAEIKNNAQQARLVTQNGEEIITLTELRNCLLLFAEDGKPLSDFGPVHLYFGDGSNKEKPIKGINKIVIE